LFFGDLRDFFTFDPVRHIMKAFWSRRISRSFRCEQEEETEAGTWKTATKDHTLAKKKGRERKQRADGGYGQAPGN
jgi:hypothetical protein